MSMSLKAKMVEVEHTIDQAEKLCTAHKVPPHVALQCLGTLAAHLALYAINKSHKALPKFESKDACGVQFVSQLKNLTGDESIVSPWAVVAAAPASSSKKAAQPSSSEKTTQFLGYYQT